MSIQTIDYEQLFGNYKRLITELIAVKEELLRQGFIPPKLVFDTEAYIGVVDLDTNGSFVRLVKEAKERHGIKEE